MKTRTRSRRSLPSPFKILILLLAVSAFCVINWTLLKAVEPVQHEAKSFESMVVEAMLEEMVPVYLHRDQTVASNARNFGASSAHKHDTETWMFNYEALSQANTDSEPTLEDWMITTSTWSAH